MKRVLKELIRDGFITSLYRLSSKLRGNMNSIGTDGVISIIQEQGVTPRTLVDAGANNSQWAEKLLEKWPNLHLISIEPHPAFSPKGKVIRTFLSDTKGERIGMKGLCDNAITSSVDPDFFAESCRFDSLALKFDEPAVLKVDCEAYTSKVLKGCGEELKKFKFVVVEMWNNVSYPLNTGRWNQQADVWRIMLAAGFNCARVVDIYWEKTKIHTYDIVFYRVADLP